MADPLAVTGGVLAVIGVADVLLRATKELFRFLCRIKDAPKEVERLRLYVKDIDGLVMNVKAFWGERKRLAHAQPTIFSPPEKHALPADLSFQIEDVLRDMNEELSCLVRLAKKHNGFVTLGGKIKFVFEKKIAYCLKRLDESKSTLVATLTLVGLSTQHSLGSQSQLNFSDIAAKVSSESDALAWDISTLHNAITTCQTATNSKLHKQASIMLRRIASSNDKNL